LQLSRIHLVQFKNYADQALAFSPRLNGFVGQNGMGKTNLLDAIYYLCMGKSYFAVRDQFIVQHEQDFFRLVGKFAYAEKEDTLVVKVVPRQRKELELNGKRYARLADHVGRFPVVIVVPDDTQLIREGSEERRRFLDNTLSQLDSDYLRHLLQYNKVVKQRNALLKKNAGRNTSSDLLAVYDAQLSEPAQYIFSRRKSFVKNFTAPFQHAHQAICGGQEEVSLAYRSVLAKDTLQNILLENREKDRHLERTTQGIHRDELVFKLGGHPLKRLGSQGQLKSFVLALKLAQYRFLQAERQQPPVLLLDDIFDKLDPQRVEQLLNYILAEDFGQIFLSDTDEVRIRQVLQQHQSSTPKLFTIDEGVAMEIPYL
jgi:DNA replication and repair protein RecF